MNTSSYVHIPHEYIQQILLIFENFQFLKAMVIEWFILINMFFLCVWLLLYCSWIFYDYFLLINITKILIWKFNNLY